MGIVALYIGALCLALYLLHRKEILSVRLGSLVALSWLATLLASYYAFSIHPVSSEYFFYGSDGNFGVSYQFMVWLTHYVIKPLAGGDYFLTYLGYASLGFLGRLFAVLIFYHICQGDRSYPDYRQFFLGYGQWVCLLLLLWPSVVFWGSLLSKDSIQYCFIFLMLYGVIAHRGWQRFVIVTASIVVLSLVRPYALVVISLALFLSLLALGHFRIRYRLLGWFAVLIFVGIILEAQIIQAVYNVSLINWDAITQTALAKQMHTHNGIAVNVVMNSGMDYWLNLPWVLLANMFLPLPGWYTANMHAWMAAIANSGFALVAFVVFVWVVFKRLQFKELKYFNYLMFMLGWSLIGFALLAFVNTNLGWADRQKIPFVTMFIIIYGAITYLAWMIKRKPNTQDGARQKILFIVADDAYFLSHRLYLAQYVQQQGWEVLVACGDTGHLDRIKAYGFRVIGFDYDRHHKLADLDLFFTLRRVITQERPDIIHNVALRVVFVGMLSLKSLVTLKKRIGKVNAIMGLGHLFTDQALKTKLMRFGVVQLLSWLFNQDDTRVIVQNSDDYKRLTGCMIPQHKTALIKGSGVDIAQYQQRIYQTHYDKFNITMASRLIEPKGVRQFYQAAQILWEKGYTHVCFHLYGEPHSSNPQSLSVETCLAWHHNPPNFAWHGYSDNMVDVYQQTEVAVLPSFYREGIPKCLIEAAACGLPLVTTNMPGCRDICHDQINGLLISPKNAEQLAQAIEYFVNNPQQIAEMGQAGRRLVEQMFTSQIVNQQTWAVYRSILKNKPIFDDLEQSSQSV